MFGRTPGLSEDVGRTLGLSEEPQACEFGMFHMCRLGGFSCVGIQHDPVDEAYICISWIRGAHFPGDEFERNSRSFDSCPRRVNVVQKLLPISLGIANATPMLLMSPLGEEL